MGYDVSHVLAVYPGNGIIYRLRADKYLYKRLETEIVVIRDLELLVNGLTMPSCEYCQSQFENYSELDKHRLEVHPPTCDYCKATFESYFELNKHKLTKHPEHQNKRTYGNPLGPPAKPPKPSDKVWTMEELSNLKDPSMYFVEMFDPNSPH